MTEPDGTEPVPLRDDEVAHVNVPPRSEPEPKPNPNPDDLADELRALVGDAILAALLDVSRDAHATLTRLTADDWRRVVDAVVHRFAQLPNTLPGPTPEPPTEPEPLGPARSVHELAAAVDGAQVEDVLLRSEWYPVPDDTVGGWAVANAPIPVSAHSRDVGVTAVGDFLTERAARHVADLHNRALRQFGPGRD